MIQWANLYKAFQFEPHTFKPRILLVLWELMLQTIVGIGWVFGTIAFIQHSWYYIIFIVGGYLVSFFVHELFFIGYASRVADVSEANVYMVPGFVATLERWTGPVK